MKINCNAASATKNSTAMGIQRSLVYFMMSLRTDHSDPRTKNTAILLVLDEDQDFLEDTIIENQQTIEMAQITNSVLTKRRTPINQLLTIT